MAGRYGFGARATGRPGLLRAVQGHGRRPGRRLFMEDYTYPSTRRHQVLAPTCSRSARPSRIQAPLEINPLHRRKEDSAPGLRRPPPAGINAAPLTSAIAFRLSSTRWTWSSPRAAAPLPVARAVWGAAPTSRPPCAAWIMHGRAITHVFHVSRHAEHMEDFAEIAGIEMALIDRTRSCAASAASFRTNEVYYHSPRAFGRV